MFNLTHYIMSNNIIYYYREVKMKQKKELISYEVVITIGSVMGFTIAILLLVWPITLLFWTISLVIAVFLIKNLNFLPVVLIVQFILMNIFVYFVLLIGRRILKRR